MSETGHYVLARMLCGELVVTDRLPPDSAVILAAGSVDACLAARRLLG